MKNKARFSYLEKVNGTKTSKYKVLANVKKNKDYIDMDLKNVEKDDIQLRVFKNNAIIDIKRVGKVNYNIIHKENEYSKFSIKVVNDNFENEFMQEIYTKNMNIKVDDDFIFIFLEFLREEDLISCTYEIEIKEV